MILLLLLACPLASDRDKAFCLDRCTAAGADVSVRRAEAPFTPARLVGTEIASDGALLCTCFFPMSETP